MARGALDAARAAGAERYATDIFADASASLEEAHEAVRERDYRLALTRALDAYDRAQEAARGAADGKARARSQAEAAVTAAAAAVDQLETRITEAEAAKLPRRDVQTAQRAAADARGVVQEARAAVGAEDYAGAAERVEEIPARMEAEIATLEAVAAKKKPARPARRLR